MRIIRSGNKVSPVLDEFQPFASSNVVLYVGGMNMNALTKKKRPLFIKYPHHTLKYLDKIFINDEEVFDILDGGLIIDYKFAIDHCK